MKTKISNTVLELERGDITNQETEAVVNAANAQLKMGGGVAGAIHKKTGPELEKETEKLAPLKPGEAVLSNAYNLPNKYIIPCLGPVYGRDKPEGEILSKCYKNALQIAEDNNIESIAFPAISTGAFSFPIEEAAKVALKTIIEGVENLEKVKKIKFVLYDKEDYEVHKEVLDEVLKRNRSKYF